jgi:hypothetical protein
MSEGQQSFIVSISDRYEAGQRALIGDDIVAFIVERTESGLDKNNRPFKNYSASYAKSIDFKIAKKSKEDPDLTLSGDLLRSLRVLSHGRGFITIGFPSGTDENDKAAWTARPERGGRDLLGIMPGDLNKILAGYPVSQAALDQADVTGTFVNEFLRTLFR